MSDFEWWFLLAYTVYAACAILALMWVGREQDASSSKRGPHLRREHFGARR